MAHYTLRAQQVGNGFALVDDTVTTNYFLQADDTWTVGFPITNPTRTGNVSASTEVYAPANVPANVAGAIINFREYGISSDLIQYDNEFRTQPWRYVMFGAQSPLTQNQPDPKPAVLVDVLGVNGYVDIDDIKTKTDWTSVRGGLVTTRELLNGAIQDEKWIDVGDSIFGRNYNLISQPPYGTPGRQLEFHFLMGHSALPGTGTIVTFNTQEGNGLSLTSARDESTQNLFYSATVTNPGGNVTDTTDIQIVEGGVAYVVMRIVADVSEGSNSNSPNFGRAEVWINGVLVTSLEGVDWGAGDNARNWFTSSISFPGDVGDTGLRDLHLFDGWTSAPDEAPKSYVAISNVPTTVATTYTNEGGAVDATTALSDNDETTFLQSDAPGSEVTLSFTPDPLFAGKAVDLAFIRSEMARGNFAFNDVTFEALDGSDVVQGTDTKTITTIAPARQNVGVALPLDSPVSATDLKVRIRNGG